jgi:alginate O-acetyltransferase complex protein AlgI
LVHGHEPTIQPVKTSNLSPWVRNAKWHGEKCCREIPAGQHKTMSELAQAETRTYPRLPMLFSSLVFLSQFLPVCILVNYAILLLGRKGGTTDRPELRIANFWLLLVSLVFYGWGELRLTTVMLATILISWIGGMGVARARTTAIAAGRDPTGAGKAWLYATAIATLGMLAYYKYANFGVANYNQLVAWIGLESWSASSIGQVVLPLGISFYTFQALSYTIDVYRGDVPATRNIIDFSCYVTMFPQLVAGPIVRYIDVAKELVDRHHSLEAVTDGLQRFSIGLAKKVLVANTVATPADSVFSVPEHALTTSHAWLGIVCYSLQIYYDFSAYSDMAIGLGRMLGFHFPENFNYPYVARSNQDFWRRWHLSLSTWFRDYLYIPLGGNRAGPLKTYRNMLVVFFLCGLWHGASWNFVAWGLYHGLFLVMERLGLGRVLERCPVILQHAYLALVAMCGWVLFRVETLDQAAYYFSAMFGGGCQTGSAQHLLDAKLLCTLAWAIPFSVPLLPWLKSRYSSFATANSTRHILCETASAVFRPAMVCALISACIMELASGTHNPFIYSRF